MVEELAFLAQSEFYFQSSFLSSKKLTAFHCTEFYMKSFWFFIITQNLNLKYFLAIENFFGLEKMWIFMVIASIVITAHY